MEKLYNAAKRGEEVGGKEVGGKEEGRRVAATPRLEEMLNMMNREIWTKKFDMDGASYQFTGVDEIVSAQFGYVSLTSKMTDVTSEVREILRTAAVPGEFMLSEEALKRIRSKGSAVGEGADATRSFMLGALTLGMVGSNKLILRWRGGGEEMEEEEGRGAEAGKQAVEELKKLDVLGSLGGEESGEFTFFKLNEWMQVEIIALFADSLAHTPWYR